MFEVKPTAGVGEKRKRNKVLQDLIDSIDDDNALAQYKDLGYVNDEMEVIDEEEARKNIQITMILCLCVYNKIQLR